MTDKQFQLFIGDNYGVQTVDGEVILDSIDSIAEADILVEWLNNITNRNKELYNENERLKKENKNLKAQLYSDDEEGICNQCKYHYLVKDEDSEFGYYNSRCRKEHYECARVSLIHCEDFEIKNGDFE